MALQKMKCGACGCETATLQANQAPDRVGFFAIVATCTGCKAETTFKIARPVIIDEWEGEGAFCTGWKDEQG